MGILVVGSVAFDQIKTQYGQVDKVLGGSATYFSLAASHFTNVRVVAVVGEDFTPEYENVLKRRGVCTSGIQHVKGDSFFWSGEYGENLNEAKTNFTHLNVFQNFDP
jgi:sugar/nucleoside kinase (ribokinase family)